MQNSTTKYKYCPPNKNTVKALSHRARKDANVDLMILIVGYNVSDIISARLRILKLLLAYLVDFRNLSIPVSVVQ
nr:hypothetical protein Itr_chr01CG24560 [Ipomoea trifida]